MDLPSFFNEEKSFRSLGILDTPNLLEGALLTNERLQRIVMVALALGVLVIGLFSVVALFQFTSWLFSSPMDDGLTIRSDSDFKKHNLPGSGIIDDPYLISGDSFKKKWEGILVRDTTLHFIIRDCFFKECHEGIRLENVANGTAKIINNQIEYGYAPEVGGNAGVIIKSSNSVLIANNTIISAGVSGISMEGAEACLVLNNTISQNVDGIELEGCPSSVIANNTFYQNLNSISCIKSNFLKIADNVCKENDGKSITLIASNFTIVSRNKCINEFDTIINGEGIDIGFSFNCTITDNEIINCGYGIHAYGTINCYFTHNFVQSNSNYAIKLVPGYNELKSENNVIFLNAFIQNNPNGISQASDDGLNNFWFDNESKLGNYWSDWNGSGFYAIDGSARTSDQFPLNDLPFAPERIFWLFSKPLKLDFFLPNS
ncbi:MAG: nitrous oxide reductase family maturation protein NosD [Candidatus Hodarchaeota archaeon]